MGGYLACMGLTHLLLLGGLATAAPIAGADEAPLDEADLIGVLARYNAGADCPLPLLNPRQRGRLLSGDTVKMVRPIGEGLFQIFGMRIAAHDRDALWLASQDPHFAGESQVIEAFVSGEGDRQTWYGLLDLPRPWTDRHWVVTNWNNHAMARDSDNVFWEHPWRIHGAGLHQVRAMVEREEIPELTGEQFSRAIPVRANSGAWAFIRLADDHTLMAGVSVFSLGGVVPERLVAEYMGRLIDQHLVELDALANAEVEAHYTGNHPLVPGGDGTPVPLYDAATAKGQP